MVLRKEWQDTSQLGRVELAPQGQDDAIKPRYKHATKRTQGKRYIRQGTKVDKKVRALCGMKTH